MYDGLYHSPGTSRRVRFGGKTHERGILECISTWMQYITPVGYFVEETAVERFGTRFPPKQKQNYRGNPYKANRKKHIGMEE